MRIYVNTKMISNRKRWSRKILFSPTCKLNVKQRTVWCHKHASFFVGLIVLIYEKVLTFEYGSINKELLACMKQKDAYGINFNLIELSVTGIIFEKKSFNIYVANITWYRDFLFLFTYVGVYNENRQRYFFL